MDARCARAGRSDALPRGRRDIPLSLTHSLSLCLLWLWTPGTFGSAGFFSSFFFVFLSGALGKNNDPARSSPVYLAGCPAYLRESGRGQPVLSTVGFRPGGVGTTRRESERGGRFLRR